MGPPYGSRPLRMTSTITAIDVDSDTEKRLRRAIAVARGLPGRVAVGLPSGPLDQVAEVADELDRRARRRPEPEARERDARARNECGDRCE